MYHELWTASCVLLILGLLCLAAGMGLKYWIQQKQPYERIAEARVVDIVSCPRSRETSFPEFSNRQVALFEFYADGRPVKVADTADTYPCKYRMNQMVRLCYNPDNPQQFVIVEKSRTKAAAAAVRALGIIGVLSGCVLFLLYASRISV